MGMQYFWRAPWSINCKRKYSRTEATFTISFPGFRNNPSSRRYFFGLLRPSPDRWHRTPKDRARAPTENRPKVRQQSGVERRVVPRREPDILRAPVGARDGLAEVSVDAQLEVLWRFSARLADQRHSIWHLSRFIRKFSLVKFQPISCWRQHKHVENV